MCTVPARGRMRLAISVRKIGLRHHAHGAGLRYEAELDGVEVHEESIGTHVVGAARIVVEAARVVDDRREVEASITMSPRISRTPRERSSWRASHRRSAVSFGSPPPRMKRSPQDSRICALA